ncbi:ATP-binding protein [Geovibrio thiophilus]|nr:transporter substrate-binding domain-containing protein [Geovibrio thiophilus]
MWSIYKPYEWLNDHRQPVGMNVDLLKALTKAAGCSYEIVSGNYKDNLRKLESGEIDMMSISPVRSANRFAAPIPTSIVLYRYIFTRTDMPYLTNMDQLKGKTVLVVKNTYSHSYLVEHGDEYNIHIVTYDTSPEAMRALSDGVGDALLSTMELALNSAYQIGVKNIRSSFIPNVPAIYGFCVNKNNKELFEKMLKAMEEIKRNGVYFEIIKKWHIRDISTPSWYYYTLIALAAVIIAAFIILIWNKMLKKQVQRKTASLSSLSSLFQMVLDAMPECIYLIGKDGQVSWTNVNNAQKMRYPITNIQKEIKSAIHENKCFDLTRLSNDACSWRIVAVTLDNQQDRLLVIMSEITENVKLRDEALMAVRLAAIGEMAATMAHEINNPTALICLNMDLIKRIHNGINSYVNDHPNSFSDLDKYVEGWVSARKTVEEAEINISESLRRITTVIHELKAYSVSKPNTFEIIDIKKTVNDALKFIGFFTKKYTNCFVFNADDNLSKIYANPFQMEQVVINLIQNACYALTEKKQKIVCSLENTEDNKYVKLSVTDEGRGINNEIINDIWNPFFTTRRNQGGTGLGLAIISRIVKEHKGYHELSSIQGKGTVVSLYFPSFEKNEV